MTIKIQVKDTRGCTSTFADRNRNATCNTMPFGFAAENTTPAMGFGVTPVQGGMSQYGLNMPVEGFAPVPNAPFMGSPMTSLAGLHGAGLGCQPTQAIVNRIAAIDPSLAQFAMQLATTDPMFLATLGKVAGGCAWTAARLVKIATIDLQLARSLATLATVNPHQALAIASVATINPLLAKQQIANSGMSLGPIAAGMTNGNGGQIPVDIYDDGTAYVIEADVPGVSIDDVDLSVTNGRLVIETLASRSAGGRTGLPTIIREKVGPRVFRREFTIGNDVDATDISARIVNGVLTIELPKKAAMNGQAFSREGSLVY
ncbi:MAG: Hsp20/alpha crystallin family protein [Phycisphaerales bacterium]|jgi:HSP20 family protein|nr:Hsp20/alpha crystallin family protein [Phycisphaerales bacterium]